MVCHVAPDFEVASRNGLVTKLHDDWFPIMRSANKLPMRDEEETDWGYEEANSGQERPAMPRGASSRSTSKLHVEFPTNCGRRGQARQIFVLTKSKIHNQPPSFSCHEAQRDANGIIVAILRSARTDA